MDVLKFASQIFLTSILKGKKGVLHDLTLELLGVARAVGSVCIVCLLSLIYDTHLFVADCQVKAVLTQQASVILSPL